MGTAAAAAAGINSTTIEFIVEKNNSKGINTHYNIKHPVKYSENWKINSVSWGVVIRAVEKFSISGEAYLINKGARERRSYGCLLIPTINKNNKSALNRIFQAYPAYIRVIGLKISKIPAQIGSSGLSCLDWDHRDI